MPRVSARAIVIKDNKILLSKYKDKDGFWYVTPGGGVETGETLEEAFARETFEECGCSLPFGDVLFIREIISDRHDNTNLKPGLHQIEINVSSYVPDGVELKVLEPDEGQVDLVWHPLEELEQIRFYPAELIPQFKSQRWDKIYCGELL